MKERKQGGARGSGADRVVCPGVGRAARRAGWAAGLGVLLVGGAGSPAGAQLYTVVDLMPPGAVSSDASDINNYGQVTVGAGGRAYLWQNGTHTDLGTLGTGHTFAASINDAGQIVGGSDISGFGTSHAFLWQNGVMQDLGTMGGRESAAIGINRHGQVAGWMRTPENWQHAIQWQNGVVQDLDQTELGYRFGFARRINDSGWVIGDGVLPSHALLWRNGVITDLGTFGGDWSTPNGINAAGQIVGLATTEGTQLTRKERAFLWQDGVMLDLGALPGQQHSVAYDISASGQIVGSSGGRAFVYTDGVMQDLNSLIPGGGGWHLSTAWGINAYGQIVGIGRQNSQQKGYLLNPPAPSAPTGLTATIYSGTEMRLAWSDTSPIETAFALWRRAASGEFVRIAVLPPNSSQYRDSGLTPGVSYTYRVRSIGLGGGSAWTEEAAALIPTTPPAAPTGLTAQAVSGPRVNLTWTDGSGHETGFGIWRRSGSGDWSRIGVGAQNATLFVDTTVAAGTAYTYRLRAHNNYGASAWSNEAVVTTSGSP